jgi:FkbM family methyltransferase
MNKLRDILINLVGRQFIYRLGRYLYMISRGDLSNNIDTNGEVLLQRCVISALNNDNKNLKDIVFFDVGANVGDWTIALLDQLKILDNTDRVKIYAFEPVPCTANVLKKNLEKADLFVEILEIALSSTSGTSEIYISGQNAGTNSLYNTFSNISYDSLKISLSSVTDFFEFRKISHVHLLKSDTEGHDIEVIRGALPLLKKSKISVLQFEYNHRWVFSRNFLRDVFVEIQFYPYKVVKLQPDYFFVFDTWHEEMDKFFEGNYALIHIDSLSWFPTKLAYFDNHNSLVLK